jgi:hypothetical protein
VRAGDCLLVPPDRPGCLELGRRHGDHVGF